MKKYDVAAYIWPSYTQDEPKAKIFWEKGFGEWQSIMTADPMFKGHAWPRKPIWGYVNESDPYVMEMEINAAADHGVNVFIYDWYWFDDAPFLEGCLDNGFLKARNNDRMKFYLMWANHTATLLWNKEVNTSYAEIWSGKHDRSRFENAVRRIIGYFSYPNYYKIDGKPVFMLYDIVNLIEGLGGLDKAREALDWMREETVKAGFPGLYLQTQFGNPPYIIDGGRRTLTVEEMLTGLGIDGGTHYQMLCDVARDGGMRPTFRDEIEITQNVWKTAEKYPVDYFPHVSVGWDNTPRYKEMRYGDIEKGIMEAMIIDPATPDEVEEIMRKAKEYIDSHPSLPAPLITVNSWNEWTEGSYLEPDDMFGYGYLEAIKKVFCE